MNLDWKWIVIVAVLIGVGVGVNLGFIGEDWAQVILGFVTGGAAGAAATRARKPVEGP